MMSRLLLGLTIAGVAVVTACGDDDQGAIDASVSIDGAVTADADPTQPDADPAQPDANPTQPDAAPPGPDAATPATCGGFIGAQCEGDAWCDYPEDNCGNADAPGECMARPEVCTEEYAPVCGCDGATHGNECEAHAAGFDVSTLGGCTAPAGMFACGWRFCPEDVSYCRVVISDVVGIPHEYECVGFPLACGDTPDCDCLAGEVCGDFCEQLPDGNFQLTCPGG